jgi:cytochrome d ubiquinol oxidase subunit II
MVSSISPAYNLTIGNAASAPYTLKVMTIVALIFTPIVLVYQGWSYWVFRARVQGPVQGDPDGVEPTTGPIGPDPVATQGVEASPAAESGVS